MRRRFIAAALAIVLVSSLAGIGTMAWFTSSATSTGNVVTTGTLILGGVDGEEDTFNTFKNVAFENLEPGEPIIVQETTLKNVGSLPFYIYRLTASALRDDNPDDDIDDTILNGKLLIDVEIDGKIIFHGRLSEMVESNGGFFNPVYGIEPDATKTMKIYAYLEHDADNNYQGLSMLCDFKVYANQVPDQLPGSSNSWESLGASDTHDANIKVRVAGKTFDIGLVDDIKFDASGLNEKVDDKDFMKFKYTWNKIEEFETRLKVLGIDFGTIKPYDCFDYYNIIIKHHSGRPNMNLVIHTDLEFKNFKLYIAEDKDVEAGNYGALTPRTDLEKYISLDYNNDVFSIDKEIFGEAFDDGNDWELIDVKFVGSLVDGSMNTWVTNYEGWRIK